MLVKTDGACPRAFSHTIRDNNRARRQGRPMAGSLHRAVDWGFRNKEDRDSRSIKRPRTPTIPVGRRRDAVTSRLHHQGQRQPVRANASITSPQPLYAKIKMQISKGTAGSVSSTARPRLRETNDSSFCHGASASSAGNRRCLRK